MLFESICESADTHANTRKSSAVLLGDVVHLLVVSLIYVH